MMFEIELTPEALDDLKALKKAEQLQVLEAIEIQLRYQPMEQTRHRKRLRPNPVAEWELCVGKFRVFYNVSELALTVSVAAVGFKMGSLLFIRGERREL